MKLNKKPVTGMKDILPEEMRIREYVQSVISSTYATYGFTRIETPCVESIENLTSKQGGDNEKLIFKVMKRGDKLDEAMTQVAAGNAYQDSIADSGLRYDLTVPLVRFYSNNSASLPSPFKALQMGNVWRADRPQRGRFRQFMQCDIDILGEPGNLAEIELILATTATLGKLGFKGFEIRISDRRLLQAMSAYAGFAESDFESVCITLDKLDKIGLDGVRAELIENGKTEGSVDKYLGLFKNAPGTPSDFASRLQGSADKAIAENLEEIIGAVEAAKEADFKMVFDPTLVRGMGYYTGTIFEIAIPQFGGSCGGGGRYDKMVGRFTGNDVPACGFSIGFERIVMLLLENGFNVPEPAKKAYLIEKGVGGERLSSIMAKAKEERSAGRSILVVRMNKNKKFQKEGLEAQGYTEFEEFYNEELKH
ncbi:MAG: histidine--tRNA ligase [Lachnospiraceae bacterium]|nr:histidine--tRNA ligase [Lachnospiraceae bacterium]